ncbi:dUTP diphosphatase [Candidatus Tachikawaea gelatinosa]|uniref:Deoxyuridine 5'-triphosphate nucleotidohydrolase n=1 Tax=Candidatus Tachikawaea gelatinosa TaxID=1410383 RepID=A0A090AQS3_9ENTR|nr:dUTP diphosphatase [Candidatus Tachikawaea gelatinosa]BAP58697.1 deoxyuridine 5'-triphosphate nucleotidohydrolase [Candidatus Tachikawaea gelatinosa]
MKTIEIKIIDQRFGKIFPLPNHTTIGSAGIDLRASITEEKIIHPDETILVPAGIAIYIADKNFVGMIVPRSGLSHNNGIILGNTIGIIDSDYQGELFLSLWNHSKKEFFIKPGDRLAQLILVKITQITFKIVNTFKKTIRNKKGFGHSGTN